VPGQNSIRRPGMHESGGRNIVAALFSVPRSGPSDGSVFLWTSDKSVTRGKGALP